MEKIKITCDNFCLEAGIKEIIMQHPIYLGGSCIEIVALSSKEFNPSISKLLFHSQKPLILMCNARVFAALKYHIKNRSVVLCSDNISIQKFNQSLDLLHKNHRRRRRPGARVEKSAITTTEARVINYVFAEKCDAIIARRLNISIKTVSAHKRNVLNKVGFRTVSELVIYKRLLEGVF
ncbi:helix-turn-helix transcriptional regulator [Enterobacter quasiroggenkampii]|uniref:helix-turn-helix transcriptional regulator n=1 Tax=Enterobacter quasiroggenkampii TaxID=2497436 RepID=UPI0021D08D71|nr:helix-turn-helix transcriptional regulator [Enterobacter quasiroggenkampii]MCU6386097.1 helix-turn-helix transcriptional regulator [Enterobacter quasiroggenkampii]MCU6395194.1 helix-turn-helix transcriptional regulator [Enterobacter quasiroggenkampii]MCU6404277.1 helix-turn-helix transcriptional regulator [Enterobacter quasiroggenkampii]MCU6417851.1 helix-turn-helix transcriptional regulator [Enterobacter quasiroggenkampii]